ncbi:MAG TPA: GAF domain-containing protein [Solirubrobacteraceae bacterium]|nr:GAF domain-containing protein [Solirubrobacteraceae bacterium]
MDPSTMQDGAPAVRVDALDMFVELLSQVEDDHSSDAFYGRLCEATCALTSMDRAVIFRYDEVRRRVRAAGAYGIDLEAFADAHVTVETAPVARQSLEEDRVIEVSGDFADEIPEEFRDLLRESNLVCTPLAAAGRWFGVILSDSSKPGPLSDEERYLLWTLGKTAALATLARVATTAGARARQLQERIDLARDVHESVIQRLFGVQLVFSSSAELKPEARERIAAELQAALVDLRRALQRPLGRSAPETHTTLLEEVDRLAREHPDLHLALRRGSERVSVPKSLESLAQSVLAEAVRNAHKHARPSKVEVNLERDEDNLVLEVSNDGVSGRPRTTGMGLKLAALEALQAGGIVEFGEREEGVWRVRMAVPV